MNPMLIAPIFEIGKQIIEKIWPDPEKQAQAQLELIKLQQAGEFRALEVDLQLALGQMKINEVEAASPDWFRGGWRPATGWTCVVGLVYQFLAQPLLPWICAVAGAEVPPLPAIDNETLMVLLTGMLGLGGMRTFERIRGKA